MIAFLRELARVLRAGRARGVGRLRSLRTALARCTETLNEEAGALERGERPWWGEHA